MESAPVQRLGFSVLATGGNDSSKPIANIIFVHGLLGHPQHTWEQQRSLRADEGERERSYNRLFSWRSHKRSTSSVRAEEESAQLKAGVTYWPQDLLPRTVKDARILTYGYDADIMGGFFKGANRNNITQHARDLMLKLEREVKGEPIIFVAHSLGGILVKEGLHWSKSHIHPRYKLLYQCTKHVLFLGVPHRGSDMANMGEKLARLANVSLRGTNRHLVGSLEVEDELLDRINTEFGKMVQMEDFSIYSFQESSGLSGMKGLSGKVVSDFSSKLDHPLEIVETIRGNHMEMARFSDANDEGYKTISRVIANCVTDIQQHETHNEPTAGNTLNSVSPATTEKRIIRIPYISNNDFIGREKELLWLQTQLGDQASNEKQHRVAVWGPGGAGKTQLVSTYAFKNQARYSAIFWVTASSDMTLRKTYAEIAKYLNLALPPGGDERTAIDSVRDWFTDHKHGDWLLVIDNANKLDEVDIHSIIPPINRGSVIITSQNRQAAGFGTAIELGGMDPGDAVALLFHRAAIQHPAPIERITGAEITRSLGYLALAIEHAGAYVQSVSGNLQEYLRQFRNSKRDMLEKSPAFSMHRESVFQTFNMSYDAIVERNMAAARLLCFMGFLDPEGVLESLVLYTNESVTTFRDSVMSDQKEFWDGIQVLTSFSLIRVKIEAEKKLIFLHPLVHHLSRARLNVENQWRWKARVVLWLVQVSVAAKDDMVYFPHVREQMQQMKEIKASPSDDQKRRSIYYCLALLQNHYIFAWHNQGAMSELHKYSKLVMEVLEEDLISQEHLSIVAIMALIEVQRATVQYTSSDSTQDQILRRYVVTQMTPLARIALENASNSQKKSSSSGTMAKTQTSLPNEDDVKQDGLLSLHTLMTDLTQTINAGSLMEDQSAQKHVQATRGSKAITTSSDEISRNTPGASDEIKQCSSSGIPSHDPAPTDQKPNNESPLGLISPAVDEQKTEKHEDISVISTPTLEPIIDSLSFKPKYLSDVFLSITPPIRVQCLLSYLGALVTIYYQHHRVAEADLLKFYSTLPVDCTEQPDHTALQLSQLLIEASRLAVTENIDGMLSIYLQIISIGHSSTQVWPVSLDYAIIMNKLGRPAEAERVIKQLIHSKGTVQSIDTIKLDQDLARNLQTAYVWLKKTVSTSQRLQEHLDQSLQTLLMTLQTARAVFGINSLSYFHAAFLLYRFYNCYHPQSQSKLECRREAEKYMEILISILESLYCSGMDGSGKQMCSAEGLQMGIILWSQGALEETVGVFDAFAQLSGKIVGENDALSRKARKAAAIAKGEWELCQKERREDVLKFGTFVFPRKVEDFVLLLED